MRRYAEHRPPRQPHGRKRGRAHHCRRRRHHRRRCHRDQHTAHRRARRDSGPAQLGSAQQILPATSSNAVQFHGILWCGEQYLPSPGEILPATSYTPCKPTLSIQTTFYDADVVDDPHVVSIYVYPSLAVGRHCRAPCAERRGRRHVRRGARPGRGVIDNKHSTDVESTRNRNRRTWKRLFLSCCSPCHSRMQSTVARACSYDVLGVGRSMRTPPRAVSARLYAQSP